MKIHHPVDLSVLSTELQEYIRHLEQVRSDFVANVSHELRTPLTVIRGYLEVLTQQQTVEPEILNKIHEQMYQQTLRMTDIIEDLLLLAHLEAEDLTLEEKKKVDVKKILQALCQDAMHIGADKHHVIELKANEDLTIQGSENELRSLFSNLIVNAVKYTPAGGSILIEWYKQNDNAHFVVTDTGIGIAKEHIPRITERFYRVDKARSRERGGTGLGLAIVKHVLLRHDASLEIESEVGKGSRFCCVFSGAKHTPVPS